MASRAWHVDRSLEGHYLSTLRLDLLPWCAEHEVSPCRPDYEQPLVTRNWVDDQACPACWTGPARSYMSNRLRPTLWSLAKRAQHFNRPRRTDYEQPLAPPLLLGLLAKCAQHGEPALSGRT